MKIKVWREIGDGVSFYVYDDKQDHKRFLAKPINFVFEELQEGAFNLSPTFTVSHHQSKEFIKSMAELAEDMGIKTDKQLQIDVKNTGVLQATLNHLEDMRTLVFKKK